MEQWPLEGIVFLWTEAVISWLVLWMVERRQHCVCVSVYVLLLVQGKTKLKRQLRLCMCWCVWRAQCVCMNQHKKISLGCFHFMREHRGVWRWVSENVLLEPLIKCYRNVFNFLNLYQEQTGTKGNTCANSCWYSWTTTVCEPVYACVCVCVSSLVVLLIYNSCRCPCGHEVRCIPVCVLLESRVECWVSAVCLAFVFSGETRRHNEGVLRVYFFFIFQK